MLAAPRRVVPGQAWAVGESLATQPGQLRTVGPRWNGKDWTRVPSPGPNPNKTWPCPERLGQTGGTEAIRAPH
jgi:hypothetical protein